MSREQLRLLTPALSSLGGGEGDSSAGFNFVFRNRPTARRALAADVFEEIKFLRAGRSLGFHHLENFRDDHARLAHNHGVADANVFAADFVLVMQSGARNRGALHEDRFEFRDRREHAGAPHLHGDGLQHGFCRRNPRHGLVNDGVARRAAATGNFFPVGECIYFQNNAVNLVRQLPPQIFFLVVMRDDFVRVNFQNLLDAITNPPEFLRGQAKFGERFEHFGMRLELDAVHRAGRVKYGADRALRDEFWVKLLERAGGGITRVGKRFFTGGFELLVHGVKFLDGHVSLAAHFKKFGRIFQIQFQRNAAHGFEIRRDVVAFRAVAARDAERELALAIVNADGHAVHFRLDDVLNFVAPKLFADGRVERAQFRQSIFILRAVALVAIRFFGERR